MKPKYNEQNYNEARACATNNKKQLLESEKCGCFYCLAILKPNLINKWKDKDNSNQENTAICPYCNKATIIGDASGYKITLQFLHGMYKTFFRNRVID